MKKKSEKSGLKFNRFENNSDQKHKKSCQKNIVFSFEIAHLIGEISNNSSGTLYKCTVKCPFCDRKIPRLIYVVIRAVD